MHPPTQRKEADEELGLFPGIKLTEKWPTKGQIEFRNVWMRYRPTTPDVLKGVSFVVKGGERIGICGRTGSGKFLSFVSQPHDCVGKSSTIQALFRIVEITQGAILIDDVDIQAVPLPLLRMKLAVIPQVFSSPSSFIHLRLGSCDPSRGS